MLQALLEAGIRPDLLVDCSVGALNATFVATDPTPQRVAQLRSIWSSITRADIFGSGWSRTLLRVALRQGHVYDDAPLRALISRFCTLDDLADAVIPVHIVTTDLDEGVARWWRQGPCAELLYASACLPGLLPPAELEGHRHVDGGVLEPVPVQRAVDLDAGTIYVLGEGDLSAPPAGRLTALQVLLRSFRDQPLHAPARLHRAGPSRPTGDRASWRINHRARHPGLLEDVPAHFGELRDYPCTAERGRRHATVPRRPGCLRRTSRHSPRAQSIMATAESERPPRRALTCTILFTSATETLT